MSGARFDTRRRALGLSVAETAIVCGREGQPVAERTINRWINDRSPVPQDAFDALVDLEEEMDLWVSKLVKMAADMTMAGPIQIRRYRTQEHLSGSQDDIDIPLGAHAMMLAWLDYALAVEGIDTEIVWADLVS